MRRNPALRTVAKRGLAIAIFLSVASPVIACPMCKDAAVDAGKTAAAAGLDFNRSIYIMLGGFAGLVGVTGGVIYKAVGNQSRSR